uniref:NADH dehydrogenase subunit 6 n=1 Tax=Encyrtus infelix TaxID=355422 RepID=A0A411FRH7_9HYME|nr:NADH dehydrogenase subunit 6 [Encyrtus infelix]QBA96090.1 NADH dehydrogenase subunit 6 [Encyrtus infelix]QBA96103.1 NADH dehydrogenase subunit 6 [Encyrtus infelix]
MKLIMKIKIFIFMVMTSYMFSLMIILSLINSNPLMMNPLIMNMYFMLYSIFSSMKLSQSSNQPWGSIFTFLIMVGGLMILFMYFISFVSNIINEMNLFKFKILLSKMLISLMILTLMIMNIEKFLLWTNSYIEISTYNNMNKMNLLNFNSSIMYMYMYNKNYSLMLALLYLINALTLTVKMIMKKKNTLRKIN